MDIEEVDHTARYIHTLHELGGIEGISSLAVGLYAALHSEHDLVIRLHERLKLARSEIVCLKELLHNDKDGE